MAIKKGDKIKVDYVGTLEDGSVFDSSEGKEPLEFEAGSGAVIKGFDEAVIGMEKDQEKDITIPPEEAYGQHNPGLIQKIPKDKLPPSEEPKVGMMIGLGTPDGKKFAAKITEVTDKEITLDLNHPLAGKTLKFKIKIKELN